MSFCGDHVEKDGPPVFNLGQCIRKEDVLHNRGSIGRMQKVFIYYVLTVKSMAGEIKGKLEKRIYNFSCHLITYGFDVRVDLFCDQSRSFDRAAWSDRELSQADWVIFVCSRSSYELLQISNSSEHSAAYTSCLDREMLNNITVLRKILYNRFSIDISTRVIPVILLEEDNNIAFVPPSLQDRHNILCIFEDTPFDYEKLDGHFERLICRMTSINRVAINNSGQNRGYIKLPSKYTEKQEIRRNGESHNDIRTTFRRAENVEVLPISTQNNPQPFYHQYHPQQHGVSPNYTSSQHTGHYTRHSTNELMQQHPSQTQSYYSAPYSRNDYVTKNEGKSSYHHSSSYTQDPRAINYSNKMSSERLNIAPSLSDHNVPANSPIIWELSQEVKEWKFLARNLDLEERVIEEIDQYTIPNKMRDKSLRVFTEWVNSALRPTWKALGEALREAEYILLYEKLLELVKSHTI
ncbi:uncharacterized protein [Dysidea avara]|uniref:uncharacterized protein isoform X2 n=1 Tax=Dysidea avara TaxID=196820 RepID=UPI0033210C2E